jgi:transposase
VERRIARLDKQAKPAETPLSRLIELLVSIPGVSYLSAITIISEIGSNMSRFPTAGHLIAWAGLCPGQNESAGKRKRSRLRKGAPWLKTMLVQCAWAAKRQKTSYYRAQFYRLRPDAVRRKPSAPSPPRF